MGERDPYINLIEIAILQAAVIAYLELDLRHLLRLANILQYSGVGVLILGNGQAAALCAPLVGRSFPSGGSPAA